MPKGGARTRSGPAADPSSLRQVARADEWIRLPRSGRSGPAPRFPLREETVRESELWDDLWSRPQAVEWERQHQELEVALFVRRLAEAESAEAAVNLGTLVRQMSDSLGMTTPGMRANRWVIVDDAPAEDDKPVARTSSRGRLSVVPQADGGA